MGKSLVCLAILLSSALAFADYDYNCVGTQAVQINASDKKVNIAGRASLESGKIKSFSGKITGYPSYPKWASYPSYPNYPSYTSYSSYPNYP
ncbi:MAG: hypothetical protein V4654_11955, partial [Bdellovibrionota bacterium]